MEDNNHHHHHHHHQQNPLFAPIDLRHFTTAIATTSSSFSPVIIPPPPPASLFMSSGGGSSTSNNLSLLSPPPPPLHHQVQAAQQQQQYDHHMMMFMPRVTSASASGGGLLDLCSTAMDTSSGGGNGLNSRSGAAGHSVGGGGGGLEGERMGFAGDIGGSGRWPRQETLTLLEIRSRLDSKFKEANQKGPLWDEVSRIMYEEHGYQRSGKKCREKFENLYKYYKKTKEGKAGRQDGKHYRFFRQLEALYGESSSQVPLDQQNFAGGINLGLLHGPMTSSTHLQNQDMSLFQSQRFCDSLSLSNSSLGFDSCSSEENQRSTATLAENDSNDAKRSRKRRGGKNWKAKIKEFIDAQMRRLIEKQEAWLERLTRTIEQKEQERALREEEWRKKEALRVEKEQRFWAKERQWIEARDASLMEALNKLTGIDIVKLASLNQNLEKNDQDCSEAVNHNEQSWSESEVTRLIQLRTSMEPRFQQLQSSGSTSTSTSSSGRKEGVLWEEIARKMACLGFERSGSMCKHKWEAITAYYSKKRKENPTNNDDNINVYTTPIYDDLGEATYGTGINEQEEEDHASPTNSNNANIGLGTNASSSNNATNESCFRFLMGDHGESNLWENYGFKQLNKGDHHLQNQ